MPPLWQRVGLTARVAAAAAAVLLAALSFDLARAPESQRLAGIYIHCVRSYQTHGHTLADGWIACRYEPTCSRYSIDAVERYGLLRGLRLTLSRIARCQRTVPAGTSDPVL